MPDTPHLQDTQWAFKTVINNIPLGTIGRQTSGGYTPDGVSRSSNIGMTQAQMNTLYTGTSLEGKVTRTPTTGWQQFTVPFTGLFSFEVQGSQGGAHGTTNQNIGSNYGGRGALISGTFLLHKDDVIYVLVGEPGRCNNTSDGGGGGGGASAVLLVDNSGLSQYSFSQTGKQVIPLIVAGGGAGQSDYTQGSEVASQNVFNDTCVLNAKITNGTNTQGGSSNSYRGGAGFTGGYGTAALLSGASTSRAGASGFGGFGGGGDTYNGGGGGAGWSGGDYSDGYSSYGGTSWIDDSAFRVSRQLAPVVRGYTVPGHVTMTSLSSDSKKILAKDSDGLKSYSADNDLWSLIQDQTIPPTSSTYDTYGVVSAKSVNGLKTDTDIEWYIKSNSSSEIIYLESLLNDAKIVSTYDMDLSVFTKIDSIRVNTPSSNILMSCLFSTDYGKTWYSYNNGEWITINPDNKSEFHAKGVLYGNIGTVPFLELTEKTGSSVVRACFLVTENASTPTAIIESISITGSVLSGWESTIKGTDYTYKHLSPANLEITFKVTGTYKINYPYSDQS